MHGARPAGKQAVAGHREKDAGLAEDGDDHGGGESADGPEFHEGAAPANAGHFDTGRDGGRSVEGGVLHESGEDGADEDVEECADRKRAENPDRHIANWVAGFLSGSRDLIESDVGEKDDACGTSDAGPSEIAVVAGVGGEEGRPVGEGFCAVSEDVIRAKGDEDDEYADLDDHDREVEADGFADADDENGCDEKNSETSKKVEGRVLMRESGSVDVSAGKSLL